MIKEFSMEKSDFQNKILLQNGLHIILRKNLYKTWREKPPCKIKTQKEHGERHSHSESQDASWRRQLQVH